MQPGTAMCFLNFYTLVFWTPLMPNTHFKYGIYITYAEDYLHVLGKSHPMMLLEAVTLCFAISIAIAEQPTACEVFFQFSETLLKIMLSLDMFFYFS